MNRQHLRAAATGILLLAVAGTAFGQMANSAGTGAAAMPHNFIRMQRMMDQANGAKSWSERMRLMQSHMALMQEQMGSMMGSMGMAMKPGQHMGKGMMNGRPGQGMSGGMMNRSAANPGDVQAQVNAMQVRMREMARMMQQMLEQQKLLLQHQAGGKPSGG